MLEARNSSRRWTIVTFVANFVRKSASSIAESPPPTTIDFLLPVERGVADRAVRDAPALQRLLRRQAELARGRAGRDDHGLGAVLVVADVDAERTLGEVDARDVVGEELGAEALRLRAELLHQLGAEDAVLEARVVLDVARDHQLAAEREALDHERLEVGARGVERGRVPGGAAADDDQIANFDSLPVLNEFGRLDVPIRGAGPQHPMPILTILAVSGGADRCPCIADVCQCVEPRTGIRCRVRGKERANGRCHHLEPAEGARRLQGAERAGDQPLPRLRPGDGGDDPAAATKINSLLDEAQKSTFANRSELTHDQKRRASGRLRPDPEVPHERLRARRRPRAWRSSRPGSTRSGARTPSARRVPDRVSRRTGFPPRAARAVARARQGRDRRGDRPRARPPVPADERTARAVADLTEEQPGRHDQGGWSQARYQRHIDELARDTCDGRRGSR